MMRNGLFPPGRLGAAVIAACAVRCAAAAQSPASTITEQARAAIVKAQQAQGAATAYSVRFTMVDLADGGTSSGVLKFVAPDRYHFVSDQNGDEAVRIGNEGFVRKAHAKTWETEPPELVRILENYRGPDRVGTQGVSAEGFAYVGETRAGAAEFDVYRYQAVRLGERHRIMVWIGRPDGLPRQYQDETDLGYSRTRRTWIVTYDPSLKILEPKVR